MLQSILNYKLPNNWKLFYYTKKKLADWIDNLMDRIDQVRKWFQKENFREKTYNYQQIGCYFGGHTILSNCFKSGQ